MMRRILGAAFSLAVTVLAAQAQQPATLTFPNYGFQINGLPGTVGTDPVQITALFLPVTDSFTPNINVQIQPYPGTREEYTVLSKAQFDGAGFTVIETKKPNDTEVIFEYTGLVQDRTLHWYSRAIFKSGKVYLVTATATDFSWDKVGAQLKACADSLKLQ